MGAPPPRHKQPRVDPHALPLPGVLQSPVNPAIDASGATDDPLPDDGARCPGVSPGASRGLRAGLRPAGLTDAPGAPGKRRRKTRKPAKPTKPKAVRMAPGAIPGAASVVGELFTVSGRNPFRIPGPAVISFSGGRTSAMMLRKILDAYGGVLPPDVFVLFSNTGREDDRTLDFVNECAERWGVTIRWLEYDPDAEWGFRETSYAMAMRNGEPFAELIRRKKALPNGAMRFCTVELKVRLMRNFMRREGYADDEWINVVGLRADEMHRVMNLKARPETKWDVAAPLCEAGVTKPDVLLYWHRQPFDLTTPEHLGNCDFCFQKGRKVREKGARTDPEGLVWWIEQEALTGRRFVFEEPTGYEGLRERVRLRVLQEESSPVPLPEEEYTEAEASTLPCDCVQQKVPSPKTCSCGRRRGQGHTLGCLKVWGGTSGWDAPDDRQSDPGPCGWVAA